ncbi:hypothetical protein [Helicovermis profundi]|uniref:Uncharacterized protein n=1 Tax=Helicovermis profundi TaxID=3065157 RepID=A0AAU9EIU8_9FIRM|nr:hypothetical protein HLPR_01550 [Clostridia bacterium S502]
MPKFLSREEIDKILGIDPNERKLSQDEIKLLIEELKKVEKEYGVPHGGLSEEIIKTIMKKMGFEDVKFYDYNGNPI